VGNASAPVATPATLPAYKRVFTRQVGNVDVRGFAVSLQMPPVAQPAGGCVVPSAFPRFQAEVSAPDMVGTAISEPFETPSPSAGKLSSVYGQVMGVQEGEPVDVVTAYVGSGVAKVKMSFSATGTTDEMAPVDGWVALVTEVAATAKQNDNDLGSIQALDSAGAPSDTATVRMGYSGVPTLPGCVCPQPAMGSSAPTGVQGSTVYACASGGAVPAPNLPSPSTTGPSASGKAAG
jgi:hypothetical protein